MIAGVATAGPWTRDLGSFYLQAGTDVYIPTEYVEQGDTLGGVSDDTFTGHLYTLYGEFGVSPGHPVQVAFSLPFARYRVEFEREDAFRKAVGSVTTNRLQDLRLLPQVALHPDAPIAAGVEFKVPLYSNDSICEDYELFRDVCAVPGHGQTDITPWFLAGGSAKKAPFWGEVGVGYLHRMENFNKWRTEIELVDGITWQTTVGANLGESYWMLKTKGVKNLQRDGITNEYATVTPSALLTAWDHVGVDLHVGWEVWANNQSRGVSYGVGVSWFN